MTEASKEADAGKASAVPGESAKSELAADQERLKEAYERAREDLKVTAERLKSEIDKIDTEEISRSTTAWIKENPGLSFFIAIGIGIAAGKVVSSMVKSDPPPSLRDRMAAKTGHLAHSAKYAAGYAADRLSEQMKGKGEEVAHRIHDLKGNLNTNAEVLGSTLAEHASHLGVSANEKTNQILTSFTEAAEKAADSLHVAARDLSKSAKKYKKSNVNSSSSLIQAAKTIFSAFIFKHLSDWIRNRA